MLFVVLSNRGNPDHGQDPSTSITGTDTEIKKVADLAGASKMCRAYIERHSLGSGNWAGGLILDEADNEVGQVSYNGTVWPPGGWKLGAEPIYPPPALNKAPDPFEPIRANLTIPGIGSVRLYPRLPTASHFIRVSVASVPRTCIVNGVVCEFMDNMIEEPGAPCRFPSALRIYPNGDITGKPLASRTARRISLAVETAINAWLATPEAESITLQNSIKSAQQDLARMQRLVDQARTTLAERQDELHAASSLVAHLTSLPGAGPASETTQS